MGPKTLFKIGGPKTSRFYNARRIKVIRCLDKKESNDNDVRVNCKDFRIFKTFFEFSSGRRCQLNKSSEVKFEKVES